MGYARYAWRGWPKAKQSDDSEANTDVTVFYSWQSDTRAAANRSFIQNALEAAAGDLRADESIAVEPVVDRDTASTAGAPDIGSTILAKIESCSVFVADVTIVTPADAARPMPNPNVMLELGYALSAVGVERTVLVQNVAFGGPEKLPFDLRQKRVTTYDSPADATERAPERRKLQSDLKGAIGLVLESLGSARQSACPLEPLVTHENVKITARHHDYRLNVILANGSNRPVLDWNLDLTIPTILLDARGSYPQRVTDRDSRRQTLLRVSQAERGTIFPGDTPTV